MLIYLVCIYMRTNKTDPFPKEKSKKETAVPTYMGDADLLGRTTTITRPCTRN